MQTTTTTQNNTPWTEQQSYLKDIFGKAQEQFGSAKPEYFPGSTVTGFTPFQQTAQQMAGQRAMAGNPLLPGAQGQVGATINGDYLNQGNPYTSGLVNSIEGAIRPGIDARFGAAGRYGSSAQNSATTTAMTNALAPLMFSQYGQERQNQLNATQLAPTLGAADYNDINVLNTIGGTQQQQGQNELNSDIQRFNFGQNMDANKLAQYQQLINGNYGGSMNSTMTGPGASGKGGGGIGTAIQGLGTAGMLGLGGYNAGLFGGTAAAASPYELAAAATMFGSDRRLKTDIKRVGKTDAGLPVYTFKYKGSPTTYMGVMADEVEDVFPEAVGEIGGGFKGVDYSMVH